MSAVSPDLETHIALSRLEASTLRKISRRIVPFLGLLYFAAFIDRVSISFAAVQMNRDLGLSDEMYGLGAGLFFIGYCLFEVPSNLILHRVGARRWISRIMISWSIVAGAMAFMRTPAQFYVLRFILGVAEAGFFPGMVYYLTAWVPAAHRARLVGAFMTAIPLSQAIGGPVSSAIVHLDGMLGMAGWRWLLLCQTLPSLLLGIACRTYLRDAPADARWLRIEERDWLTSSLAAERAPRASGTSRSILGALASRRILALSVCYFGADMCLYGVVLWLPKILSSMGVAQASLGYWVALPYGLAAFGMVWWSRRSDRTRERVWHLALAAAVGFIGVADLLDAADSGRERRGSRSRDCTDQHRRQRRQFHRPLCHRLDQIGHRQLQPRAARRGDWHAADRGHGGDDRRSGGGVSCRPAAARRGVECHRS
jgi:MFS transporter, ACS family, tartrate transporter